MPKGDYNRQIPYNTNPNINKPIEEIYGDLDAYTVEVFEDEPDMPTGLTFTVILPPCLYEGKFIKGIYFSEGVDILNKHLPQLSDAFFSIANSRWCNYPWSKTADAYFGVYPNSQREAWFRKNHPEHFKKVIIPIQDAEFTNDYYMQPNRFIQKDIDVICVSRMDLDKNIPMLAKGLKIYRQKYPNNHIKMTWIVCHSFDFRKPETMDEYHQERWQEILAVVPNIEDYIIPRRMMSYDQVRNHYNRAKVDILGSLLEGTNRSIHEAMSCNVPVICFDAFNKYLRGEEGVVIPEKAGLYAEFDPESVADRIYQVLQNQDYFKPRLGYLKHFGRRNFFNLCLDSFDYYRENVPDYQSGNAFNNLWLDLAVQHHYGVSLFDFIYYRRPEYAVIHGMDNIVNTINRWIQVV
jgi:glycosyltransferase involved in cell wall biosynthesis